MAALVLLDGARTRPQRRRGISATSDSVEWMKDCTPLAEGRGDKTGTKRKRRVRVPELLEEIVIEILVRLPVKDLLKSTAVCKAWRAIISDPAFIRAHLRYSASKWEQDPSFVISPHTLNYFIDRERIDIPSNFSNHIHFYQWKQDTFLATFMHAKDFGEEFGRVRDFVCCDGLVLAPTDTRLYLFNPATRDSITLPDSDRNNLQQYGDFFEEIQCGGSICYCAGLGLDPRTGKYKVVQAFYRSMDDRDTDTYHHMGMEVFTIDGDNNGSGAWREIMDDPPYPAKRSQTSLSVKGFLFWHIDRAHSKQQAPWGLLRLSLADETFGVTGMPDQLDPSLAESLFLDVVREELCVTARTNDISFTIWTLRIQDGGGQRQYWEQRFTVSVSDICHPLAFLPQGRIMLRKGHWLYSYELSSSKLILEGQMDDMRHQGRRSRTWKHLFSFSVNPYVQSLVRLGS